MLAVTCFFKNFLIYFNDVCIERLRPLLRRFVQYLFKWKTASSSIFIYTAPFKVQSIENNTIIPTFLYSLQDIIWNKSFGLALKALSAILVSLQRSGISFFMIIIFFLGTRKWSHLPNSSLRYIIFVWNSWRKNDSACSLLKERWFGWTLSARSFINLTVFSVSVILYVIDVKFYFPKYFILLIVAKNIKIPGIQYNNFMFVSWPSTIHGCLQNILHFHYIEQLRILYTNFALKNVKKLSPLTPKHNLFNWTSNLYYMLTVVRFVWCG